MWPKKQVSKPLLKPANFCRTLCRGQNLKILPGPFDHCLQNIWSTPTQNCWSKRCCLGDPIPIWSWTKLSKSYGILIFCGTSLKVWQNITNIYKVSKYLYSTYFLKNDTRQLWKNFLVKVQEQESTNTCTYNFFRNIWLDINLLLTIKVI